VRMGIALVIDVKKAGVEMNRTATLALLAHTTNALQSITHSTVLDGTRCVTGELVVAKLAVLLPRSS
jgi:hypothetical protein